MHCYVILNKVFQLMCIMMWLHYQLLRSLDIYKVCLCYIVLLVTICTVGYICLFHGDQIFMYFVSFLSMIIFEVLYTCSLRYNICSPALDIRISTCFKQEWSTGEYSVDHKVENFVVLLAYDTKQVSNTDWSKLEHWICLLNNGQIKEK